MQRLKKCLGIDIGAMSVKIAEIVTEKSGVRVTKLVQVELPPGGGWDTERVNLVSKTIKETLSRNKITTKQAVFSVPGQSVFIRRIRVPRTTEERLHRIVAYEARQQIPFALDNSLMEYQVFDFGDVNEVEVLLVAIKKDIVTEFMRVVGKSGLKPIMVSVSSLALFNFQVFDSTPFEEHLASLGEGKKVAVSGAAETELAEADGDIPKKKGFKFPKLNLSLGKKKKLPASVAAAAGAVSEDDMGYGSVEDMPEDVYEEVRAYVNLGAQTFDLVIARHGKQKMLGFTRSVPWSGNELSRSLQEKLGLDSFATAEEVKRSKAIIIMPGREDEAEEAGVNADASEFATSWADRMILDLRKSFDFYISQPDGYAVDSIQLTGGQALQRNLASYVEDKLGIPVDIKTQTENAALAMPAFEDAAGVAPYAVALGLGLTGVGLGQVSIDFLPNEMKSVRDFKKKNIEVILLLAAIGGMILVGAQAGKSDMENMERWITENRSKWENAQQSQARINTAREARKALADQVDAIGQAIGDKKFWLEFLGTIESIKPADVLITNIHMEPDGKVTLVCETENQGGSISTFVEELKKESTWVKNVELFSPRESFSAFINKIVNRFTLRLDLHWKQTRLAPARSTLPPGAWSPTPAPSPGAGMPGMPGRR